MAISTNGTVLARLAGALYNTQMSNATYKEVAALDPSALANTLYARDFSSSTDLAVATTLVTNLGLTSVTGLNNWVAAQLTAAGSAKGAKVVDLLNSFAQMTADTTYGAYATAFNTKVDAALALSQTTDNKGGTFAAAGVAPAAVGAVFALTAGTDVWTGGAGDDTVNATVATLGALDVIDGGAGNDTLNIVDTAAVASLGSATFSGIETVKITSGGAVGAIAAAAGVNTAGTPQVRTLVASGTFTAGDTITVKINGNEYTATVGSISAGDGRAEALDAVRAVLDAHVADTVTTSSSYSTGSGTSASTTTTVTAAAGWALPTITVAKKVYASASTDASLSFSSAATANASTTDGAITTTAAVVATNPVATVQTETVTIGTPVAAVKVVLSVDGADYTANFASSTSASAVGDQVAALANSILGAGSATNASGVVTIKSLTAGKALPALNLQVLKSDNSASATDTWVHAITNTAANAAATTAAAIAAPAGTTSYTVKATGVANVSGASTTALDVSGTAVKTSGGSTVTVAGSDSVHVSGAKGAVTVKTGKATTSMTGAVASDTGSTAGDAAGVYVTGGTTVSVTVAGDNSGAVKIGAASYEKAAVNSTGYPKSNGNVALTPTGDVTVSGIKTTTGTDGKVDADYNGGNVTVYMNGGTSATVKGGATVAITDVQTSGLTLASTDATATIGTSTLATATLAGLSGNATIKSDAITTVNVSDTLTAVTVNVTNSGKTGANSGAITFNVSNLGGASANVTLKDDTATSVNVGSAAASAYDKVESTAVNAGSKSYIVLDTAKATAVTFSNDKSVALAASTLPVATTITATGSGALDLGTVGTLTSNAATVKTTSIDASAATGAVTVSLAATINGSDANNHALSFKGGSGNDVVTLTGAMTSGTNAAGAVVQNTIDLGAGNDTLLKNGGSIAAGSTVNGGDGVDTIAATLLTVGNSAQITGFEILGLDSTSTFDTDLLSGATGLSLLVQGGTYTNVKTSQGLTIAADVTAGTNTLTFGSAVTTAAATTDAYTVTFGYKDTTTLVTSALNEVDGGVVVINGIETVNVISSGSGYIKNALNLTDTSARVLVITGDKDLNIDFGATDSDDNTTTHYFGTTGQSTDSNGVTSIDASALTGKLDLDTTDVALAYNGVLSVSGGSNDDTIVLAAHRASVNGGAGDDTITTAAGVSQTLTGGAGKDTFIVGATVYSTGPYMATITDLQVGDKLTLASKGTETFTTTKVNVGSATSLASAFGIAASSTNGSSNGAIKWFQYGGNTYVVEVMTSNASVTDLAGTDLAVKLTGLIDLSTATLNDYTLTIA